ncbi:serine dehydrogenasease [Myxococcota bacterium]|nr:serine dehydrogenasease [Myxococcota bacterium]
MGLLTAHTALQSALDRLRAKLERILDADVMAIESPIFPDLDTRVRVAIEGNAHGRGRRRSRLAVVLGTDGGIAEVVERIVKVTRQHYAEVWFLVPNRAMSAGTLLALSGDDIFMDYFAVLGPIDPQIFKNERLVPALSYVYKYEQLLARAQQGQASPAEIAILLNFDQAELHAYEKARDLSITYLQDWLVRYKFKGWAETETAKTPVTLKMKKERAREIAEALNEHTRWNSHGRGLDMSTLTDDLKLKIRDFGSIDGLPEAVQAYNQMVVEAMRTMGLPSCVHARNYF